MERTAQARYPQIGAAIKSARLRKGYSQSRCARETGMARFHWIRLEQGLHQPKQYAASIADLLGIPESAINPADDDEEEAAVDALAQHLHAAVREVVERLAREA